MKSMIERLQSYERYCDEALLSEHFKALIAEADEAVENIGCEAVELEHPALILLDGVLHAMVEQDLNVTIRKFVRYNLPKILRYSVGRRSRKR